MVGGAHVSDDSSRNAYDVVRTIKPDAVLLELCNERKQMLNELMSMKPPAPMPPFIDMVCTKPLALLNVFFWLSLPIHGLEALTNTVMGAEMGAAARAAEQGGSSVVYLIDREVSITLLRAAGACAAALEPLAVARRLWEPPTAPPTAPLGADGAGHAATAAATAAAAVGGMGAGAGADAAARGGEKATAGEEDVMSWYELCWAIIRAHTHSSEELDALRVRAEVMVNQMLWNVGEGEGGADFGEGAVGAALTRVIGAERDEVLAFQCREAATRVGPRGTVVAILGAAHVKGIVESAVWNPHDDRVQRREKIMALFDAEEAKGQIHVAAVQLLAIDLAALGVSYGVYRQAKQMGGGWFVWAKRTRNVGTFIGAASFVGTCTAAKLGYDGVRELQRRRLVSWVRPPV